LSRWENKKNARKTYGEYKIPVVLMTDN